MSRDAIERRLAKHTMRAAQSEPTLAEKKISPHVLRHTAAMRLLAAGVDSTVIALWLGHADTRSTQQYIHADITIKERALALLTPPHAAPGRYRPTDEVLAYLDSLG
jgi:integrase/recombinase XerD